MTRLVSRALAVALLSPLVAGRAAAQREDAPQTAAEDDDAAAGPDGAGEAARDVVRVRVVDVAGGRVYVAPGRGGGLARGDRVRVGGATYTVVAVTEGYAAAEGEGPLPEVGARGRARVALGSRDAAPPRLPDPLPLERFAHQWPDAERPAEAQDPAPVPLGRTSARGAVRADLFLGGYAALPTGEGTGVGMGELRGRVHATPFAGVPLAFDVDAAARVWVAPDLAERASGPSRPNLYVRELALRYGDVDAFSVAGGRLRYAASLLGPIDGARVSTPRLHGVQVAAFGGGVPDPRRGLPTFDASRFGVEVTWADDAAGWRPSATLVAHGSVFEGAIDERRLAAAVSLFPGDARLGGYAELAVHDADNPWAAPRVELAAASLDGSVRVGTFDVGARFDLRRPERSRWLAAQLPPGWLCAVGQAQADGPGACLRTDDARYLGSVDVGQRLGDRWLVRAGGQVIHYPVDPTLSQWGGWAELVGDRLADRVRATLRAERWDATLVDRTGGRAAVGVAVVPGRVDVGARYRLFVQRYRAELDATFEHAVGVELLVRPHRSLDVSLDADLFTGADADLVLVQLLAAWHL